MESPWKKISERELPSGMKIKIRNITSSSLVLAGLNIMPLLNTISEGMKTAEAAQRPDIIAATREYLQIIFDKFLIEPKISMEYPTPEGFDYSVAEIDQNDLVAIKLYFQGAQEDLLLASFRKRAAGLDVGPPVPEVREDAVGVPEASA